MAFLWTLLVECDRWRGVRLVAALGKYCIASFDACGGFVWKLLDAWWMVLCEIAVSVYCGYCVGV